MRTRFWWTCLAAALACRAAPPTVVANDNRTTAGTMRGDTLVVALVVQRARWYPEADGGPYVDVEALGEDGKPPSIPAPMLRVRTGQFVSVTIRNTLRDSTAWVHMLQSRPADGVDSVGIAPGDSTTVTFAAGEPGTYVYGASAGTVNGEEIEREQMIGAFIVDSSGTVPPDRIFVMNIWGEPVDSVIYRNALTINGKSFPYGETISATIGDTLRWRWINGTIRPHPMHLHGFYFTVLSRGSHEADTAFVADARPTVVTERMEPLGTMTLSWVPDRDGRWMFHCHIPFHTTGVATLNPDTSAHVMHGDQHMTGLTLGIDVAASPGWTPPARENVRRLRLFVREREKLGRSPRALGYALEHSDGVPDEALTRVGGPPLVLTRGQPTDITVINQLAEPTVVHWHGLELESFSDGVSGWSGRAGRAAPSIAAGDSFTARLTMPRAGTFMYHTHLNDLRQLTSGLYGAIIVQEPGDVFDSGLDHVYVAGWDGLEDPRLVINGDSALAPMTWRLGRRHRLRFVNIGAAERVEVRVMRDSSVQVWRAVSKDGAALSPQQMRSVPATVKLDVGETADFEFQPPARGAYLLTLQHIRSKIIISQRIDVR